MHHVFWGYLTEHLNCDEPAILQMKPILIDALHINMGGALTILNHLVDRLVAKNVNFVLLKDDRCPQLKSEEKVRHMMVMSCAESKRKNYYKAHRKDFKTVLCLGNIPPAIKMPVPVYTYIHNVSLLKIPEDYGYIWKLKSFLKRWYIRFRSFYTDAWIVQTSNTENLVKKYLPCKGKDIFTYPFYEIPAKVRNEKDKNRTDYIFVGEHTYAKGHEYLIDAWVILSEKLKQNCPVLHLTVGSDVLKPYIENAIRNGARIINHGRMPFEEVCRLYQRCKAIVYPSLNESLGLGIVEAIEAGCDVIGCDLPYLHSVCLPSETFVPQNPDSIVAAILKYRSGTSAKTQLTIKDEADNLIDFLHSDSPASRQ